jgi:hypothetical protein
MFVSPILGFVAESFIVSMALQIGTFSEALVTRRMATQENPKIQKLRKKLPVSV